MSAPKLTASELAIIADLAGAGEDERLAEFIYAITRRLSRTETIRAHVEEDPS